MLTKEELARIYWLSGSVCAGKTTVSSNIAERMNWNVYHCDEWRAKHRDAASPEKHTAFYTTSRLKDDALWLRPIKEQVETEEAAAEDEFRLSVADRKRQLGSDDRPLIFDGYVHPKQLLSYQPSKQHIFYLIAEEKFQLRFYEQRPWIHDVLARTSDKKLAWHNWMQRDLISARNLENQVKINDMPWLLIDGKTSVEDVTRKVLEHFTKKDS